MRAGQKSSMLMSERLKFLLISPSVIASDPRVLAHLSVLSRYGDVTTVGYGSPPSGVEAHIQVADGTSYLPIEVLTRFRRIPRNPLQIVNLFFRRFDTAARKTAFTRRVVFETKELRFDLICTNDVHAVRAGFHIAKQNKCPIWVDMHEYAPLENESDWKWRLLLQPYVRYLVQRFLPIADAVSTVGRVIQQRYQTELGREVDLVRNTTPFINWEKVKSRKIESGRVFRLVHVGAAIRARLLENMILAVKTIDTVTLDLLLIPTDKKYYGELLVLAQETDNVRVVSPIQLDEVVTVLNGYSAGLVVIPPTNYNDANCLPNKFFQYIQARLPVISTPIPEVKQIIEQYQIGWVSSSYSISSIQEVILTASKTLSTVNPQKYELVARLMSRETDDVVRTEIVEKLLRD